MPPNMRLNIALVACISLAASCSVLPDMEYPPARFVEVTAIWDVDPGLQRIPIPHTDGDVTVFELASTPALPEHFDHEGRRFLHVDEGTDRVRVTCRCRIYGKELGDEVWFRPLDELFPGATRIHSVDVPSP